MDGESYPGEFENAARLAEMDRRRRVADGWHPKRWADPRALLRGRDEQGAPPREVAYRKTRATFERGDDGDSVLAELAERSRAGGAATLDGRAALAFIRAHAPVNRGPE